MYDARLDILINMFNRLKLCVRILELIGFLIFYRWASGWKEESKYTLNISYTMQMVVVVIVSAISYNRVEIVV